MIPYVLGGMLCGSVLTVLALWLYAGSRGQYRTNRRGA